MNRPGSTSPHNILTGQTERIASASPATSVRIWAKFTVFATFLLLIAGALVTGNKAAMSDPTWPQFVGHWYPKYWAGGLVYEDTHRIVAAIVGIITVILAIVIQLKDPRRFMKKLGWGAVALVIVQALFGALIIKSVRHPAISMAHGVIAQAFFCLTIAIAIYSSRTHFRDLTTAMVVRAENRGYLAFMKFAVILIFIQVVLGGGVRHSNDSSDMFFPYLIAHIAGAFSVLIAVVWFNLRTWHVYRDVVPLKRTAIWSGALLGYQVIFGILSIFANRARLQPEMAQLHHVIVSTAHLLGGATLLALMFGSYLRAYRLLDRTNYSQVPGKAYQSQEVNA
jgi:cytochrome c oxidase assembly protein subunit 15